MVGKEEILALLEQYHIPYEITEHKAVYTMEQLSEVPLPYPEDDAKNLFVRDDKKKHYFLITVRGRSRLDLKLFSKEQGTRRLSMASAEDLHRFLHLPPGSVTPFGLLNDESRQVIFYLDQSFLDGSCRIGIHPNDNRATLWISAKHLVCFLKNHHISVHLFNSAI